MSDGVAPRTRGTKINPPITSCDLPRFSHSHGTRLTQETELQCTGQPSLKRDTTTERPGTQKTYFDLRFETLLCKWSQMRQVVTWGRVTDRVFSTNYLYKDSFLM